METIAALISNSSFDMFLRCITDGDAKTRKAFVLLARHMSLPIGLGSLYRLTLPAVTPLMAVFRKAYPPPSTDYREFVVNPEFIRQDSPSVDEDEASEVSSTYDQ